MWPFSCAAVQLYNCCIIEEKTPKKSEKAHFITHNKEEKPKIMKRHLHLTEESQKAPEETGFNDGNV